MRTARQKLVLSLAALGVLGIGIGAVALRRDMAIQYYVYRLRTEPDYLRAAIFEPPDGIQGEALRVLLRASERQASFRREVAGRTWLSVTESQQAHILGPLRTERRISVEEATAGYRLVVETKSKHVAGGGKRGSRQVRSVIVDGCFIRWFALESNMKTWGLSASRELVYPAVVRLAPGAWLLLDSDHRGSLLRFYEFDRPLTAGATGTCGIWYHSGSSGSVRSAQGEAAGISLDLECSFVVRAAESGELAVDLAGGDGWGFVFDPERGVGSPAAGDRLPSRYQLQSQP